MLWIAAFFKGEGEYWVFKAQKRLAELERRP